MRYVSDEERIIVQNQLLKLLVAFKNICVAEGIWCIRNDLGGSEA